MYNFNNKYLTVFSILVVEDIHSHFSHNPAYSATTGLFELSWICQKNAQIFQQQTVEIEMALLLATRNLPINCRSPTSTLLSTVTAYLATLFDYCFCITHWLKRSDVLLLMQLKVNFQGVVPCSYRFSLVATLKPNKNRNKYLDIC